MMIPIHSGTVVNQEPEPTPQPAPEPYDPPVPDPHPEPTDPLPDPPAPQPSDPQEPTQPTALGNMGVGFSL